MKHPFQPFSPFSYLFLFAAVFRPLVFALISQYFFGLRTCHLCVIQRIPYLVITIVVLFQSYIEPKKWLWVLLTLGFVASTAASGYHVGVEKGWIALSQGCLGESSSAKTAQELLQEILTTTKPRCDKPTLIVGFSMASWNLFYSVIMMIYLGYKTALSLNSSKDSPR